MATLAQIGLGISNGNGKLALLPSSLHPLTTLLSNMAPSRPRSLRTLTFGFSKRQLSPGPPSPTFSDVTNASAMNFGANGPSKIITRANLKASIQAYEDVSLPNVER